LRFDERRHRLEAIGHRPLGKGRIGRGPGTTVWKREPGCSRHAADRETWKEEKREMEPMQPMKPMKPMAGGETWWPDDLGQPSSSGSQNGMRYAFFSEKRRLLIEQGGKLTIYVSGDHHISGVSQRDGQGRSLEFMSGSGLVKLDQLKRVD
jgi:hypothetical protein